MNQRFREVNYIFQRAIWAVRSFFLRILDPGSTLVVRMMRLYATAPHTL